MPKYSFDTKISDLLNDKDVVSIVKDLFPSILSNPMLEYFKQYRFNEILPFIYDKVGKEKIEEFALRLSKI